MKSAYVLLIAALCTTAACSDKKKKEAAGKTGEVGKAGGAGKTSEPALPAEPEPAPEPPPRDPVAVERAGTLVTELADRLVKAADDAGTDCLRLGLHLRNMTDAAKQAMDAGAGLARNGDDEKEFRMKYKALDEKLAAPRKKMERCASDAGVQAFLAVLPLPDQQ
jgi:hypothetical protein